MRHLMFVPPALQYDTLMLSSMLAATLSAWGLKVVTVDDQPIDANAIKLIAMSLKKKGICVDPERTNNHVAQAGN